MALILKDHWYVGDDADATNASSLTAIWGVNWYAETFTAESDYDIKAVILRLRKVGTPVGNFNVTIYTCTTNDPATAKPAAATASTASIVGTDAPTDATGADVILTFSTTTSLTAGNMYAIVMSNPNCSGTANTVTPRYDNSGTVYAGGHRTVSGNSGASWGTITATSDFLFRTYEESAANYDEGVLIVSSAGAVVLIGETYTSSGTNYDEGVLIFYAAGGAALVRETYIRAAVVWPPARPAVPADEDTLHNNTLIAVGYDADGLGAIYFKET